MIQESHQNEREIIAKLQLPDYLMAEAHLFTLHPSLMDGAVHSAIALVVQKANKLHIPFNIGRVTIYNPLPSSFYSCATFRDDSYSKINIQLIDHEGRLLVSIEDLLVRPLLSVIT